MKVEIDQSGKVEQTNLDTVIAFSNDIVFSVLLKKGDKRKIKSIFRSLGLTKIYIPVVFAALIAVAIQESQLQGSITVDTEYPGYNKFIKKLIEEYLMRLKSKTLPVIKFGFVGKESRSHYLSSMVLRRKIKANKVVDLQKIVFLIETKKSGTT